MKQKDPSEKVRSKEKDSSDSKCNTNNSDRKNSFNPRNYDYLNRHTKSSDKKQLKQMPGEVLLRARTTFSNISDTWRPRGSSSNRIRHRPNGYDGEFQEVPNFGNITFKNLGSCDYNKFQKPKQKCLSGHYTPDADSSDQNDLAGPFSGVKIVESEDVIINERPRKKLSFRDPEIIGGNRTCNETLPRRKTPCIIRSSSLDGLDIEKQLELEVRYF